MDDSKIIKIPIHTQEQGIVLKDPEVSMRVIHTAKPKGAPIPGVNYGVDLVTDKAQAPIVPPIVTPAGQSPLRGEKNKGHKQFMPYSEDNGRGSGSPGSGSGSGNGYGSGSGSQGSFRGSPQGSQGSFRGSVESGGDSYDNNSVDNEREGGRSPRAGYGNGNGNGGTDRKNAFLRRQINGGRERSVSPTGSQSGSDEGRFEPTLNGNGSGSNYRKGSQKAGVDDYPSEKDFSSDASGSFDMDEEDGPEEEKRRPPYTKLSYEQVRGKKIESLAALKRLEEQGYEAAGKKCGLTSSLEEIEEVLEKLRAQRDLDKSIKFQRDILVTFVGMIEYACSIDDYNIFDLDMEGWSKAVYENVTDYDEVFEELHYKYKTTMSMPPEVRLLGMLGMSGYRYHLSRQMLSKASNAIPGFKDVMGADPELKRRYQDTASRVAQQNGVPSSPPGGGFSMPWMPSAPTMKGGAEGGNGNRSMGLTQNKSPSQPQMAPPIAMNGGGGRSQNQPRSNPPPRSRVPMNDPDDVDGLLASIKGKKFKNRSELNLSEIDADSVP